MARGGRGRWHPGLPATAALMAALVLGACSPAGTTDVTTESSDEVDAGDEQRHPDVIAAELESTDGMWRLHATLSSPYDTPERYADAFRALTEDGRVLGVRELAHDHANEQPFTRSLTDLQIPDGVERITVQGRDQRYGWGGATVELDVPAEPGRGD